MRLSKHILWVFALFSLSAFSGLSIPSFAQNVRWDLPITTTQAQGGNLLPLYAIPGAGIKFYTCSGSVCTSLATTYISATSGTTCPVSPAPMQVVLQGTTLCVSSADPFGNMGGWFQTGQYMATVTALGGSYNYYFTIGGGGSGGGSVTAVSVATANGFQGSVSNPTTTPAISINVDSTHILPVKTGSAGNYLNQAGLYSVPVGTAPPVTTKGDLFGFSTIPARLPVGADLNCLVADSTQPLGIGWENCPNFAVSGQANGVVPLATAANAIGAQSHLSESGGKDVFTQPVAINSSGASRVSMTYNATPVVPGSSTTAVVGADSSGHAVVSAAGGSASRLCDVAGLNGTCGGGSPPVAPDFSVQASNAGQTAFASDANILINTSTHTVYTPSLFIPGTRSTCQFGPTYYAGGTLGLCQFNQLLDGNWTTSSSSYPTFGGGGEGIIYGLGGSVSNGGGGMVEGRIDKGPVFRITDGAIGLISPEEWWTHKASTGDFSHYSYESHNAGVMFDSDEGWEGHGFHHGEATYTRAVFAATTGSNWTQTVTFSAQQCPGDPNALPSHVCMPSTGSRIANVSAGGQSGRLGAGSGAVTGGLACATWLHQFTLQTGSVSSATVYGCALGVNIDPNTTDTSPVSETVTISGGTGSFTVGDTVVVSGNNFTFQSKITAASGSAGAQTLAMPMAYVNNDIAIVKMDGGNEGGWLSFDGDLEINNTAPGYIYIGSTDGTHIIAAMEAYALTNFQQFPANNQEPVQIVANPTFATTTAYSVNTYFYDGTTNCGYTDYAITVAEGCVWKVTTGGTSGGSTPSWTTIGTSITTGSVTATNLGAVTAFHVYNAARVIGVNNIPCNTNSECFDSWVLEPNLLRTTVGDQWDDPNFDLQVTHEQYGSLNCQSPGQCRMFDVTLFGPGAAGGFIYGGDNGNQNSTYYTSNFTSTGMRPPNYGNIGGTQAEDTGGFFDYFLSSYSPSFAMFQTQNHWPGQTKYEILQDASWGELEIDSTDRFSVYDSGFNSQDGFQYNGAAPSGHCLIGNGTWYVDSATCGSTLSGLTPGTVPVANSSSTIVNSDITNSLGSSVGIGVATTISSSATDQTVTLSGTRSGGAVSFYLNNSAGSSFQVGSQASGATPILQAYDHTGGTSLWGAATVTSVPMFFTSSNGCIGFASSTAYNSTPDTCIWRPSAGTFNFGSATANSATATINVGTVNVSSNQQMQATGTATSSANFGSAPFNILDSYWTGSAAVSGQWTVQDLLGAGANPTSVLTFTYGGSGAFSGVEVPNLGVNARLTATSTISSTYATLNNCSSSASPAVCGAAAAGSVVIAAGSTSVTVNTTAVSANSQIILTGDDSLGTRLGVTCNSTLATALAGIGVTARTATTSFTITTLGTVAVNPMCVSYTIIN